jgi:superfamily II DNA or RNA helicase
MRIRIFHLSQCSIHKHQYKAHTSLTPTTFTVADYLTNTEYRFGLSATPIIDNLSEALIGTKLHEFAIKDSMQRGDIMTPQIIFHTIKSQVNLTPKLANFKFEQFELKEMKIYNNLYDKVICLNSDRNKLAADIVEQDLNDGRIVLILVKKVGTSGGVVSHAELIQAELITRGIHLGILHGKSKNQEQIKADLANETIKGLIASVGILSEGVSINSISSLVFIIIAI